MDGHLKMDIECDLDLLLLHTKSISEQDRINVRRVLTLYPALKKDESLSNVTEILINARYIYDHYYMTKRNGHVIYDDCNACYPSSSSSSKDEIIFIASIYLSLCIWNAEPVDCQFWKLMDEHIDPGVVYDRDTIRDGVRHVFVSLSGRIIRHPLIINGEMKNSFVHMLIIWFCSYRYSSFIEPLYITAALSVIVHDLLQHNEKQCYRHSEEKVRIVCQIMVTYFTYMESQYDYEVTSLAQRMLTKIKTLSYYEEDRTSNDSPDRTDCIPPLISRMKKYTKLECVSVLSRRIDEKNGREVTRVYRGVNRDTNERYTIKRYMTESETETDFLYVYIRETAILCALRHHGRYIGIAHNTDVCSDNFGYIYMSPNGVCLASFVNENRRYFNESAMESIFYDMVKSLEICDANDIVHNDVKPENFIVEDGHVKLIDFGLATCLHSYMTPHTDNVQSVAYRAPELLMGDPSYSHRTDIWALACTIYEICTGIPLFGLHQKDKNIDFKRGDLSLVSRSVQLTIILLRTGRISEYPFTRKVFRHLRQCPLWEKCMTIRGDLLHGKYRLIDWSTIPQKLFLVMEWCLCLVPHKRPCATVLIEKGGLSRGNSLF